ncbi:MAG: hypothetical protein WC758_03325 [Candidatus Woesearchaeota archaeon]|jgi:hypothetical protein
MVIAQKLEDTCEKIYEKFNSLEIKYNALVKIRNNVKQNYAQVWKFDDDNLARMELLALEDESMRSKNRRKPSEDEQIRIKLNNLYEYVSSYYLNEQDVSKFVSQAYKSLVKEGLIVKDSSSKSIFEEDFIPADTHSSLSLVVGELVRQPRVINEKLCDYLLNAPKEEILSNWILSFSKYAREIDDEKENKNFLYSMHKLDSQIRYEGVMPLKLNSVWLYERELKK